MFYKTRAGLLSGIRAINRKMPDAMITVFALESGFFLKAEIAL